MIGEWNGSRLSTFNTTYHWKSQLVTPHHITCLLCKWNLIPVSSVYKKMIEVGAFNMHQKMILSEVYIPIYAIEFAPPDDVCIQWHTIILIEAHSSIWECIATFTTFNLDTCMTFIFWEHGPESDWKSCVELGKCCCIFEHGYGLILMGESLVEVAAHH